MAAEPTAMFLSVTLLPGVLQVVTRADCSAESGSSSCSSVFGGCEFSFPAVRRQRRQCHGDIATGDLRVGFHLRHAGKIVAHFLHQLNPKLLVRHFPTAKLQLNTHLVAAVEEFFGVPDFRQIIVLVDVNAELNFLQLSNWQAFYLSSVWKCRIGIFQNRRSCTQADWPWARLRPNRAREFELCARRRSIA